MNKLKLLSPAVAGLVCLFALQVASAETMEERLLRLEKMVEELQGTLLEAKREMAAMKKDSKEKGSKGGVVKTDGKEDITVSTTGGGLKLESSNGNKFQFGGRLMLDYDAFDDVYAAEIDGDGKYDSQNEAEWRRTRLTAKGTVAHNWHYVFTLNIDDGDDSADLNTGYLKYTGFKPLAVQVGKFKEPFGLERLTSSKWISTIERAFHTDLLDDFGAGQPKLGGVQLSGYHKEANHLKWAVGVFDDDDEDSGGDDAYGITGRVAMTPEFEKGHFLHLGAAYSIRDEEENRARVSSRLGIHTNEKVQLGCVEKAEDVDQLGLEAAYVRGPFSLQAEYLDLEVDGNTTSNEIAGRCGEAYKNKEGLDNDLDADTWYLQAAYTLTGETRGYKMKSGRFDKIKPKGPFGAWELVARYEDVKVDDDVGEDSEADKWIIGVNWYANKNVKFMANYLKIDLDKDNDENYAEDDGDAFSLRAQYAW